MKIGEGIQEYPTQWRPTFQISCKNRETYVKAFVTHSSEKTQGKSSGSSNTPMTPADASRIQSAAAKANGGKVPAGSFAARAQSAAAHNVNAGIVPSDDSFEDDDEYFSDDDFSSSYFTRKC